MVALCGGCAGGGKKAANKAFAHGNHAYFAFRTRDGERSDAWVQAVREHSVVNSLAQAKSNKASSEKASANRQTSDEEIGGAMSLSFFRRKSTDKTTIKKKQRPPPRALDVVAESSSD